MDNTPVLSTVNLVNDKNAEHIRKLMKFVDVYSEEVKVFYSKALEGCPEHNRENNEAEYLGEPIY